MDFLLPGYPQDNPILKGIAAISSGMDPGSAILARDNALSTAIDFASAALQAAIWLPAGSLLLADLLEQATAAFKRAPANGQDTLLAQAVNMGGREGAAAIAGLAERWRAIVEAR